MKYCLWVVSTSLYLYCGPVAFGNDYFFSVLDNYRGRSVLYNCEIEVVVEETSWSCIDECTYRMFLLVGEIGRAKRHLIVGAFSRETTIRNSAHRRIFYSYSPEFMVGVREISGYLVTDVASNLQEIRFRIGESPNAEYIWCIGEQQRRVSGRTDR